MEGNGRKENKEEERGAGRKADDRWGGIYRNIYEESDSADASPPERCWSVHVSARTFGRACSFVYACIRVLTVRRGNAGWNAV